MARHRRYPVKKVKKLKPKDSMERMSKQDNKKQKNRVPTKEDLDDQPFTRSWLDIQEAAKEAAAGPKTRTGRKRAKNKFYEMTAKMGFKKRPWENEAMLVGRVMRSKNRAIDDELIKVKSGAAGRDPKELEADFKELDEKERRKKLLKVAAAEKRRKLREKEERFRQSQLAKEADLDFDDGGEMEVNEDDEQDDSESDEEEVQRQIVRKSTSDKKNKKSNKKPDQESRKRLTSNEKARLKKKESNEGRRGKFLMLNAREVIPFNERVDAPPKFSSKLRKTLDPLFAQAGKKDLLLKDLIKSDNKSLYLGNAEENSNGSVNEVDRLRVINAYRQLKASKK